MATVVNVPGRYRSLRLRTRVTLEPRTWLEIRLRGRPAVAAGVGLFLSTVEGLESGFLFEDADALRPVGRSGRVLAPGVPHDVELVARGAEFEAFVDGEQVAAATEWAHADGSVTVLTAAGAATLEGLSIEPLPEPPAALAARERLSAAAAPLGLLLVLGLLGAAWLRLPLLRAFELGAFALVPLACAFRGEGVEGRLPWSSVVPALLAGGALLFATASLPGRRAGKLRTTAFVALGLPALLAGLLLPTGRPVHAGDPAGPAWEAFEWTRLQPGLVSVQHPMVRRYNNWLVDHRFRGRAFAREKAPGSVRILSLGSSSTWGHGIDESLGQDYPTLLEGLLRERLPDVPLEVINGAIRGSTSARLYTFLRETLLEFAPDIVTVSLYYNDSSSITRFDELPYLERIASPGFEHTWLERWRTHAEYAGALVRQSRLYDLSAERDNDTLSAWKTLIPEEGVRSPVERFESNLTAIAGLLRERGIALVLIKEPVRGNLDLLWKREFYAAMERVGAAHGAPVLDPTPALKAAGGATLFMDQVHPLPEGNRVMAAELARVLEPLVRQAAERARDR